MITCNLENSMLLAFSPPEYLQKSYMYIYIIICYKLYIHISYIIYIILIPLLWEKVKTQVLWNLQLTSCLNDRRSSGEVGWLNEWSISVDMHFSVWTENWHSWHSRFYVFLLLTKLTLKGIKEKLYCHKSKKIYDCM